MPEIGPKRVRPLPIVLSVLALAAIVCGWLLLPPLWHEYQAKRAVRASVTALAPVQDALNEFIARTGFLPGSNLDAGLPAPESYASNEVASIRVGRSALITVTLDHAVPLVGGQTIVFVPEQREHGEGLRWRCDSGTVEPGWLPAACQFRPVVTEQSSDSPLIGDLEDLKQQAAALPALQRDPLAGRASSAQRVIAQQIAETASIRRDSLQYFMANVSWPASNSDIGLPAPNRAGGTYLRHLKLLPDGSIEMRFNNRVASLDGHRFWIRPTMPGQWRCDSTLPDDHLPSACDTALR